MSAESRVSIRKQRSRSKGMLCSKRRSFGLPASSELIGTVMSDSCSGPIAFLDACSTLFDPL
eukprot:1548566-Rhodomonas_salina.1